MKSIVVLFLLAAALPVRAAITVTPLVGPKPYFTDNNGKPCSGCKLWTYAAGTTTPQLTYSDPAGSVANTNPVILDSAGRLNTFITGNPYKFVLETAIGTPHGSVIWTQDNYAAGSIAGVVFPVGVPNGGTGLSSVTAGDLLLGNGISPLVPLAPGEPLRYLRSKPNVATPAFELVTFSPVNVRDYNFPAISPAGTLTASVPATVTVPYAPLGASGTDTHHYFRIIASGTPEAVLIAGGTCASGSVTPCTFQFTPTFSHGAGYQIVSATDGWQEAVLQAQALPLGSVHAPTGWYSFYAPVYIDITANKAIDLGGDGYGYYTVANATVVNNLATTPAFQIVGGGGTGCEAETILHDFSIHGSATSGTGISASNACQLRIEHIFEAESQLYGMSCGPNCYGVTMDHSYFYSNGLSGVSFSGVPNAISLNNVGVQNNCRQAPGVSCHGMSIDGGFQVSVKNGGFGLDGVQPLGGFPSVSYELSVSNSTAVTLDSLYFEQPLTNAILLTNVQGFNITGTYMQQGGITMDATTKNGALGAGNQLVSGNPTVTISNAVNNGGLCEITLSTAPPVTITTGSFYNIVGISGAPACNGKGQVQNPISSTHFTSSQAFSGTYTSGGTYERTSGMLAAGSSGNSNIHILGGSDLSDATLLFVGGDLLPGPGPDIASAGVITPTWTSQTITGSAAIATMTPPSGFAGDFCSINTTGTWTVTTGGNFAAAYSATAQSRKCWQWIPALSKWY